MRAAVRRRVGRFVSTMLVCCLSMHGQLAQKSSLNGRVLDPSGNGVEGALVVVSQGGERRAGGVADARGGFSLEVPDGEYSIVISASGFASASRVLVLPKGGTSIEISLQLATVRDFVNVVEAPGYQALATEGSTKTSTPLLNLPQSISIVGRELMKDHMMMSIADVVRYVPGVTAIQGENNRDQVVIRGNSSSADFFVNGVRDDVQYYRDLYNVERVEALKGPNAMIFGRGGGGGVINRVTKEAGFTALREVDLQIGQFGHKRVAGDFDYPFSGKAAMRINGVYENSGSFRDFVSLERYGITPAFSFTPDAYTRIGLSYEHFHDGRTADRGVPSFMGVPANVAPSTFFGDPSDSSVRASVNIGSATVDRQFGRLNLRDKILVGDYDRGYQNYVPGAVTTDGNRVGMSAYNNATWRRNVFNQTDITVSVSTGRVRHTLLWGAEVGGQRTANFRNTGYFSNTSTTITVPLAHSAIDTPVTFRQSSTDADNRIRTGVAAAYVQDQIELGRFVQVVAGVRVDRFDLNFFNRRNGDQLERVDHLLSPRAGLVVKPAGNVSIYANYSVSWLPSSGDQFSSLTTITQQVKPEKFSNYETGVKWDIHRSLSITAAAYRLDRTNTRATDPNDPTRIIQTGSQRTSGFEFGINGTMTSKWRIAAGYSYQDAVVRSATVSARTGARVAQVPRNSFSAWQSYQLLRRLSAGIGILNRSDMFAAIDDTVTLPGYTRADAGLFYAITERTRLQVNVENLLDKAYFVNADGNNNISPGSPRSVRMGLIVRF